MFQSISYYVKNNYIIATLYFFLGGGEWNKVQGNNFLGGYVFR